VVIVLHCFEFVRRAELLHGKAAPPQRLLTRRFERLCAYLANNAHKYQTSHFADLDENKLPEAAQAEVPVSSRGRTIMRQVQQLVSRVY
jgi:hypothetical protein